MTPVYLLFLLVSIACMVLVDHRFRLVFWRDARRAAITVGIGAGVLLLTDLIGIALGVFGLAPTWAMTGILLAPELPLEEIFFLVFLAYLTMNLLGLFALLDRRARQEDHR